MANSVNAGENELKRVNFGSNLEQWKVKYEGGWSVATFQRRDVPTSRRWVNQYNSQQAVSTSRRQREIYPPSLKAPRVENLRGDRRRTNEGTEFQSSSDTDFEEVPLICIVSDFWILE